MTKFIGAVIDGPLIGRNITSEAPNYCIPVIGKIRIAQYLREFEPGQKPITFSKITYTWREGYWSCRSPMNTLED